MKKISQFELFSPSEYFENVREDQSIQLQNILDIIKISQCNYKIKLKFGLVHWFPKQVN